MCVCVCVCERECACMSMSIRGEGGQQVYSGRGNTSLPKCTLLLLAMHLEPNSTSVSTHSYSKLPPVHNNPSTSSTSNPRILRNTYKPGMVNETHSFQKTQLYIHSPSPPWRVAFTAAMILS